MFGRDYVWVGGRWRHNLKNSRNCLTFHVKRYKNVIMTSLPTLPISFLRKLVLFPSGGSSLFQHTFVIWGFRFEMCFYFSSTPTLFRLVIMIFPVSMTDERDEWDETKKLTEDYNPSISKPRVNRKFLHSFIPKEIYSFLWILKAFKNAEREGLAGTWQRYISLPTWQVKHTKNSST